MITSPTPQVASTIISVRLGPMRSLRTPHPKEASTAMMVRSRITTSASPLLKPIAVLTGSE